MQMRKGDPEVIWICISLLCVSLYLLAQVVWLSREVAYWKTRSSILSDTLQKLCDSVSNSLEIQDGDPQ